MSRGSEPLDAGDVTEARVAGSEPLDAGDVTEARVAGSEPLDAGDVTDARVAALHGYIDDAGQFPPASLPLEAALEAHLRSLAGPYGWLVNRFVCPADRLDALAAQGAPRPPRVALTSGAAQAGGGFADALAEELARAARSGLAIELVEVRLPAGDPEDLAATVAEAVDTSALPDGVRPLAEPADSTNAEAVHALVEAAAAVAAGRHLPLGVKLRCGGPTPAAIPPPGVVAAWLVAAAARGVAGKATAGLHHPRPQLNLAVGAREHGFLNMLAGAALAVDGASAEAVEAAVADDAPDAVTLDRRCLAWRDDRWDAAALRAVRARLLLAQGSCSIDEPVADLVALGVLPAGAETAP